MDGEAYGTVLATFQPISFLAGVDAERGFVSDKNHELYEVSFVGRILVFPSSFGSSVGSYVIYRLKKNNVAPAAIVNKNSDIITVSGCAIARIPLIELPYQGFEALKTGDLVRVDGSKGYVAVEKKGAD